MAMPNAEEGRRIIERQPRLIADQKALHPWGTAMLQRLASHSADCLDRAASTERRATEMTDPALKADYQQIAANWRQLPASYQFAESLERFILHGQSENEAPFAPPDGSE